MKSYRFALAILVLLALVTVASAADQMFTGKIDSITVANDKNGNEYARIVVLQPSSIDGVNYVKGVPVMAFGATTANAKSLKKGDMFKAIVQEREYRGQPSYTVLAWPSK